MWSRNSDLKTIIIVMAVQCEGSHITQPGHQCPAAAECLLWSPWAAAALTTSQRQNPSPSPWTLDRGEQLDTCLLFIPSYLSSLSIVGVLAMTMTRLPIADIAMLPIYVSTVGGVTAPVFAVARCTSRCTWVSSTKTVMPPPLPGLPGPHIQPMPSKWSEATFSFPIYH